jgi:hypothetical protein
MLNESTGFQVAVMHCAANINVEIPFSGGECRNAILRVSPILSPKPDTVTSIIYESNSLIVFARRNFLTLKRIVKFFRSLMSATQII